MNFDYGAFDGQQGFLSPDELFAPPQVMNFILQYGQDALDALANLDDDQEEFLQQMLDAGLLEESTDEDGNRTLRMTNKLVRGFQHRALLEVFQGLQHGNRDGHETRNLGRGPERSDGTRAYTFGDPLSEIDLGATMRNAIKHAARRENGGIGLPLQLSMNDVELFNTDGLTDCATVMLIDLSGSMMRYGRFLQAKRIALGMAELIRARFPQDTLDFVTFHTLAEQVREADLPLIMPKPVTIHDYQVRLRVPLEQARANPERVPPHFTNLQLGLREARRLFARKGAANKQVFIITDGQPTAHVADDASTGVETLYLLYPPHPRTAEATLTEAQRCRQQGIRVASFALIEDYYGMDWVGFIDQLTRLTRGLAYYCTSHDLSSTVIESYLSGKKRKSFVG